MALTFATRSSAAKLTGRDYRTVGKQSPDAELIRTDGKRVALYLVNPDAQDIIKNAAIAYIVTANQE